MQTQNEAIIQALTTAAGQWVPMPTLARIAESLNIHSRVDEIRHRHGISIENRMERHPENPKRKISYYRIPLPAC